MALISNLYVSVLVSHFDLWSLCDPSLASQALSVRSTAPSILLRADKLLKAISAVELACETSVNHAHISPISSNVLDISSHTPC